MKALGSACWASVLAGGLLGMSPAFALGFAQAGENLTYFEYARQAGDYCETRGAGGVRSYNAWMGRHEALYRETLAVIRAEAGRRGLQPAEQDQVVEGSLNNVRLRMAANLADKPPPCARLDKMLDGVSSMLKR